MSKFTLNSSASKKAVAKAQEKGSRKRFKMSGEKAALLLIGPVGENEPVFGTNIIHQHWGQNQDFICASASPKAFEQKDKLVDMGWKLRNKYDPKEGKGKKHSNPKIKDLWQSFMPKTVHTINVLDLNDIEKGIQQYDAPKAVMEVIFDEINELDGDLTTICDFKEGRRLLVQKAGSGLRTKYKAKFSDKRANLDLSAEDEDALAAQVSPLSKCQTPLDEAAYEKVFDYLCKKAEKLGVALDDLDEESNDEVSEEADGDGNKVDSDFDDDNLDEEIEDADAEEMMDDEENDFDEKPSKAASGKKK